MFYHHYRLTRFSHILIHNIAVVDNTLISVQIYICSDHFSSRNMSELYAPDMRVWRFNIFKYRLLLINSTWYLCRESTFNIKFCINEMQIAALCCKLKLFKNRRIFSSIVDNSIRRKLIIRANTRTHSTIIYFSIKENIHSIVFNIFLNILIKLI